MTNLPMPADHAPDEPYCNGCGDCCRGMDDEFGVEIQPSDAERIAAWLQLEIDDFLEQYTTEEWEEYEDGALVAVNYLKPLVDDPQQACIFLKANRCLIHDVKPIQCYLGWPDASFLQRLVPQQDPSKIYSCLPEDDEATLVYYPML